jgi:hypothetical protein
MDKNHEQATRGLEAQQVIDNPAYQTAMRLLKESVDKEWRKADVRDREGQMLLLQFRKTVDRFEQILAGLVDTGRYAERKIVDDQIRNENALRKGVRRKFNI